MKLWQQYPDLAVFPGSLLLADTRPEDAFYPSTSLSPEQLVAEEPALSPEASRKGARLYGPEGCHCNNPVLAFTGQLFHETAVDSFAAVYVT